MYKLDTSTSRLNMTFGEAMHFRPTGLDVDIAKCLLISQSFDLVLNMVFNSSLMGLPITLLQLIFSLPFLGMSTYLFHKFKSKFSLRSMQNVMTIAGFMVIHNGIMIILRLLIGLKLVLSQDD